MLARFGRGAAAAALLLQGIVLTPAPAAAATAEALFADGNRLFRDDLYWAALLRYRQAAEAGMDSALLHYNTGVAHYRAGQYDRARQAFAQAADEPRLAWRVQYNLGLTELAAGNRDAAADLFRRVRDQQAEPQLAALAKRALMQLRTQDSAAQPAAAGVQRTQSARPFGALELHATVGVGSDDNAFRSPDKPYADRAQAGAPAVVPVVQSGVFYPLDLVARYSVNSFEHESFFGSYRLAGRYYQDAALGNANEFAHEAAVGSEYRRREDDRERWIFSAFTIAQHDETWYDRNDGIERDFNGAAAGDRLSYVRYGPELRLRQAFARLAFSGRVSGQIWNYEDSGGLPEYDHEYLGAAVGVQYRFTETSLLRVNAEAWQRRFGERPSFDLDGRQPIDNPPVRYDYTEFGATARQRITRTTWFGLSYARSTRADAHAAYNDYIRDSYGAEFGLRAAARFRLRAAASYRNYAYSNAFAFNEPAAGRKTLETLDAELLAEWRLSEHFSLTGTCEYRKIASNDTRIEYARSQYVLGLRWKH